MTEPATTIKLSPEIVLLLGILGTSGGNVFVNGNVSQTLEEIRKDNKVTQGTLEAYGKQLTEANVHFERLDAKVKEHDDWIRSMATRRAPTGGR